MMGALAIILIVAVAAGVLRVSWRWFRTDRDQRESAGRLMSLVVLQSVGAGLLYLTLTPAVDAPGGGTLVVATRGATLAAAITGDRVIALPEAPRLAGAERVPDLATALRRFHPARLRVVGDGLPLRDREAVQGLRVEFAPTAEPRGLVEFAPPPPVAAGAAFRVGGRVAGIAGASVELLDPAGRRVSTAAPDATGAFTVAGATRGPGPAAFMLRIRDRRGIVETATVPVWTDAAVPMRVLLLAGTPGPEVKYLRRWASDAGLAVHGEIATGAGETLGDAHLPLTAATLARFDIAIIDGQRWLSMAVAERATVLAAVRDGLGLLIRVDGPVTGAVRVALRPLGFAIAGGTGLEAVTLPAGGNDDARLALAGPGTRDAPTERTIDAPQLSRWTIRPAAPAMTSLRPLDGHGEAIAVWRAAGEGRVGLWPLADSYRLVLAGQRDVYGELWGSALSTLGRGERRADPVIATPARVGERVVICGITGDPRVVAPNGSSTHLLVDRASGDCAGFWPTVAGWHLIGEAGTVRRWPFAVVASGDLPNVAAAADRRATIDLAKSETPLPAAAAGSSLMQTPWPWFAAWLAVSGLLWWRERSRPGSGSRAA